MRSLGPPSVSAVTGPLGDVGEGCSRNVSMGRVFLLLILTQEADACHTCPSVSLCLAETGAEAAR